MPAQPGADDRYQVFVLRIWPAGPRRQWRAAIEPIAGGKRHLFTSLDALTSFLGALAQGGEAGPSADLAADEPGADDHDRRP